jgi:hypothetical protein
MREYFQLAKEALDYLTRPIQFQLVRALLLVLVPQKVNRLVIVQELEIALASHFRQKRVEELAQGKVLE